MAWNNASAYWQIKLHLFVVSTWWFDFMCMVTLAPINIILLPSNIFFPRLLDWVCLSKAVTFWFGNVKLSWSNAWTITTATLYSLLVGMIEVDGGFVGRAKSTSPQTFSFNNLWMIVISSTSKIWNKKHWNKTNQIHQKLYDNKAHHLSICFQSYY